MQALISAGADIHSTDALGATALHWAAWVGYITTVRVLIAAEAAVNATDDDGTTPLYYATKKGHIETAQALIAAGAKNLSTISEIG